MADTRLRILIESMYQDKGVTAAEKSLQGLGKAGDTATVGVEKMTSASSLLSGAVGKLVAGGALAVVGQQLLAFGKASIDAASDVQEMSSKFDTVFKNLGGEVTAELQTFADAANRSIFDLKGFAATLQDTFVPLGFARENAADMSVQLVKLAEDLASFNNLNTADVVNDLQSALVGNTETLRKYGVVATQAAIDEKALAMGYEFTKGHMDAQTKAAVILQIALDSTTDAQGDAIKTADSYANMSKGLDAAMQDLKVTIGNELLPAASDMVALFTVLAEKTTKNVTMFAGWKDQMETIQGLLQGKVNTAFQDFAKWLDTGTGAVAVLREAMGPMGEAFIQNQAQMEKQATTSGEASSKMKVMTAAVEEGSAAIEENAAFVAMLTENSRKFAAQYEFNAAVQRDITQEGEEYGITAEMIADAEKARAAATEEAAKAAADLAEKQRELAAASGEYFDAAINSTGAVGFFNESLEEMSDSQVYVSNLTNEQRGNLDALQEAYDKTAEQVRDYDLGIKGANMSDEERAAKINELNGVMAGYSEQISEINSVGGEYANVAGSMSINQDAVNQSIYDSAVASGASAEQLAILGGALGLYSDEAVEAALKSALIQAKINELTTAYLAGQVSVSDMRIQIRQFTDSLENFPDTITTSFVSDTSGWNPPSVPGGGGGGARGGAAGASGDTPDVSMDTGGIIPGGFMQPVQMTGHGGELVANPSQQANLLEAIMNGQGGGGGKGGGAPITINVFGSQATPEGIATAVSRKLTPPG